jgi:hypothetical protein
MQNMITQALAQMDRAAPTYAATNQLLNATSGLFNKGTTGLVDAFNKIGEVKKQAAIGDLISGVDISDPYTAQSALFGQLSQIPGVSATEALGLSTAATKSAIDKMKYQNLLDQQAFTQGIETAKLVQTADQQAATQDYRNKALEETSRHNLATEGKVTPKGFGAITDDYGTTYIYDKDTGNYKPIVNTAAGAGAVPPKNIKVVNVTDRDSYGRETTTPYTINAKTGNVVKDGIDTGSKPPVGTKQPTLSEKDKAYADSFGEIGDLATQIDTLAKQSPGSFGLLDQYTGRIGSILGTEEGLTQRKADAIASNLKAGFAKSQMSGVLSDQDIRLLSKQIPTTADQPHEVEQKVNFIKDYMAKKNVEWYNRVEKSNPGVASKATATSRVPLGMQKQRHPVTGEYRLVPIQ